MADPWPASLPEWRLGTDVAFGDGTARTQNSTGPADLRRRSSAVPDVYDVPPKVYTGAQAQTLRTFYKVNLKGGALPFEKVDLIDDATVEFRFVGPPSLRLIKGAATAADRLWSVSFTVEQMP